MANIKKISAISRYQMIVQFGSAKNIVILVMLFFYIRGLMEPVNNFLNAVNIGISPYIFPVIMSDYFVAVVILICYLVLICDAPFISRGYLFVVSRSGKKCWAVGESIFLLIQSVVYTIIVLLFLFINLIPNFSFEKDWGKAIRTLSATNAGEQFNIYPSFSEKVVNNFTASDAMIKSIAICILGFWCIGLIVFILNYITKSYLGIFMGMVIIFLDIVIYNFLNLNWVKYSPASLMKLSTLTGLGGQPTYLYGISMFAIADVMLIAILLIRVTLKRGLEIDDRRNK